MSFWMITRSLISQNKIIFIRSSTTSFQKCHASNIYEPDYLHLYEPEIPIYDSLNVQLKGYDYPVLEKFQKHVHKIAETLEIQVDENWATPAQKLKVQKYMPVSSTVETEYNLTVYERNVQISDIPSTRYSVLLRIMQESLPEGVSIRVHESLEEHQEVRYVPDNQLLTLKAQLMDMGGPSKPKKK